jgi:iron complex transport system substrate-binding protein
VALAPHIVENLFAIGAGDRVVGAVAYSDYPAAAKNIERVGGVTGLSLERIVALQPDLVVAWQSGIRGDVLAVLDRLQIPYYVDEIRSLAALSRSLRDLGALTGQRAEASAQARRIDRLRTGTRDAPSTRTPGLFIQIWDDPLQSIGRRHLLTEVIARCGGRSITAELPGLAPQVSLEAVLEADPALIVVESEAQGKHWARFPGLRAVAQDRIRIVDPDLLYRPTLRLLDGMAILCGEITALRSRR